MICKDQVIPPLHPGSTKWYWLKWSADELGTATITNATWSVPAGLDQLDTSIDALTVGVKLGVNTMAQDYKVEVEITTSDAEALNESIVIPISEEGH